MSKRLAVGNMQIFKPVFDEAKVKFPGLSESESLFNYVELQSSIYQYALVAERANKAATKARIAVQLFKVFTEGRN